MSNIDDQQSAAGEDDYDAAFAEFADAKDAGSNEDTAGEGDDEQGDASTEAGQVDPANVSADDKTADTTTAAAADQAAAEDLWANATPAQRAAFEAAQSRAQTLEHADRSNRGRLSTLQRQLNDFVASGAKPASDAPRGAAKVRAMLDSDAVKAVVSDYGEASAPLVEVMRAQQEVLEAMDAAAEQQETQRTAQFLEEQGAKVLEAHPDYNAVAKSEAFTRWYEASPQGVRDMIERNAERVVDAAEVNAAVRLFKAETGFGQTQPPQGKSRTDTVRTRQLQGSRAVTNRGPGVPQSAPDDYDAAFEYYAAKKAAQRR